MINVIIHHRDNSVEIKTAQSSCGRLMIYDRDEEKKFDVMSGDDFTHCGNITVMEQKSLEYACSSLAQLKKAVPYNSKITQHNGYYIANIHYIAMPGSLIDVVSTDYETKIANVNQQIDKLENKIREKDSELTIIKRKNVDLEMKNDKLLDKIYDLNKKIDDEPINKFIKKVSNLFK